MRGHGSFGLSVGFGIALLLAPGPGPAHGGDITTRSGRRYANATVTRVEADRITVAHDAGIARIPMAELPPDLQAKYGRVTAAPAPSGPGAGTAGVAGGQGSPGPEPRDARVVPTGDAGGDGGMLYPIRAGTKYGYIDARGEVVVPPQYGMAWDFADGRGRVLVGEVQAGRLGAAAAGRFGFVDADGRLVIPATHAAARDFSEGLAAVSGGYIDTGGRLAFASDSLDREGRLGPEALLAAAMAPIWPGDFSEGLAVGHHRSASPGERRAGSAVVYVDRTGRPVIRLGNPRAMPFREGLAAVQVGKWWGFIDRTGRDAVPTRFVSAGSFGSGLAPVQVEASGDFRSWGYIDRGGAMAIPVRFTAAREFRGGRAWVQTDVNSNRWICIDPTGREVFTLPPSAGARVGDFHEGLAWVSARGSCHFVDEGGNRASPDLEGEAGDFRGGLARVVRAAGGEEVWSYIDRGGRVVWASDRQAPVARQGPGASAGGDWEVWVQPPGGAVVEIYPDEPLGGPVDDAQFVRTRRPLARHTSAERQNPSDAMTAILRFPCPEPPFVLRLAAEGHRTHLARITSIGAPYKRTLLPRGEEETEEEMRAPAPGHAPPAPGPGDGSPPRRGETFAPGDLLSEDAGRAAAAMRSMMAGAQPEWDGVIGLLHDRPERYTELMRRILDEDRAKGLPHQYGAYSEYLHRKVEESEEFARKNARSWKIGLGLTLADMPARLRQRGFPGTRRVALEFLKMESGGETFGYDWRAEPEANEGAIRRWEAWIRERGNNAPAPNPGGGR